MSEANILYWLQGASPSLDPLMIGLSTISAHALIWIILSIPLLLMKEHRKDGLTVLIAIAVTMIVVDLVMKPMVGRTRPFVVEDFQLIVDAPSSYSFPSGHTANSFVAATCFALMDKRLCLPAMGLATCVGISRMYLFVHWPTDVLAGAIVGITIGVVVHVCVERISVRADPAVDRVDDP